MAKIYRRQRRKASEILIRAEKLERRAEDPKDRDHPDWLRDRAERRRRYAIKKDRARTRKADERRKAVRDPGSN